MNKENDGIKGIDTTQTGKIIYASDDILLQTILCFVNNVFGDNT